MLLPTRSKLAFLGIELHREAAHVARQIDEPAPPATVENRAKDLGLLLRSCRKPALVRWRIDLVGWKKPWAPEPRACTIRSGMRSWSKWVIFSAARSPRAESDPARRISGSSDCRRLPCPDWWSGHRHRPTRSDASRRFCAVRSAMSDFDLPVVFASRADLAMRSSLKQWQPPAASGNDASLARQARAKSAAIPEGSDRDWNGSENRDDRYLQRPGAQGLFRRRASPSACDQFRAGPGSAPDSADCPSSAAGPNSAACRPPAAARTGCPRRRRATAPRRRRGIFTTRLRGESGRHDGGLTSALGCPIPYR